MLPGGRLLCWVLSAVEDVIGKACDAVTQTKVTARTSTTCTCRSSVSCWPESCSNQENTSAITH